MFSGGKVQLFDRGFSPPIVPLVGCLGSLPSSVRVSVVLNIFLLPFLILRYHGIFGIHVLSNSKQHISYSLRIILIHIEKEFSQAKSIA